MLQVWEPQVENQWPWSKKKNQKTKPMCEEDKVFLQRRLITEARSFRGKPGETIVVEAGQTVFQKGGVVSSFRS